MATRFLTERGAQIICKNFRLRDSEIDIVFVDNKEVDIINGKPYLVFCEVKYRSGLNYGSPYEAVDYKKALKISRAARYFLYSRHYSDDTPVRFDVISIVNSEITHIKNAFEYVDR